MKHYIAFAAAFISVAMFLTAGCNFHSGQKQGQKEQPVQKQVQKM